QRHKQLQERAALFTQLAADGEAPTAYVLEPHVVFGSAGLRALLAPPPTEQAFDATSDPHAHTAEQELVVEPRDDRLPSLAALPSLHEDETPQPSPSWSPPPAPAPSPPLELRSDDSDRLTR